MNKTSNTSSIPVDPSLRQAAEDALTDAGSMSGFVERRSPKEFAERAMRAKERAEQTGILHTTEEVLDELDKILEAGRKRRRQ